LTRPVWQLLIRDRGGKGERPLSCEECLRVLDYYVDQAGEPDDTAELRLSIARHLRDCSQCRFEMERRLDEWEQLLRD
jgi:hypothetical protein